MATKKKQRPKAFYKTTGFIGGIAAVIGAGALAGGGYAAYYYSYEAGRDSVEDEATVKAIASFNSDLKVAQGIQTASIGTAQSDLDAAIIAAAGDATKEKTAQDAYDAAVSAANLVFSNSLNTAKTKAQTVGDTEFNIALGAKLDSLIKEATTQTVTAADEIYL